MSTRGSARLATSLSLDRSRFRLCEKIEARQRLLGLQRTGGGGSNYPERVRTLLGILDLPEVLGRHARECGHRERRLRSSCLTIMEKKHEISRPLQIQARAQLV